MKKKNEDDQKRVKKRRLKQIKSMDYKTKKDPERLSSMMMSQPTDQDLHQDITDNSIWFKYSDSLELKSSDSISKPIGA